MTITKTLSAAEEAAVVALAAAANAGKEPGDQVTAQQYAEARVSELFAGYAAHAVAAEAEAVKAAFLAADEATRAKFMDAKDGK